MDLADPSGLIALLLSRLDELAALPAQMQGWLVWLAAVTIAWPLLLIRNRVAMAFLALTLPALALQALILVQFGMTRLMAVPHLLLWIPALVLLLKHRQMARDAHAAGSPRRVGLRLWMSVAAATLSISLVLDVRDALAWVYGVDRPYGSRQIDLGPLIDAGSGLIDAGLGALEGEGSGLEPPAAPEGAPAGVGGGEGGEAEDDDP